MATSLNLSGQDHVYADKPRDYLATSDSGLHEIRVVTDAMPTALARIFGLLATMSLVPFSTSSSVSSDDTVSLSIKLRSVDPSTIDLLVRKISQVTEIRNVTDAILDDPELD